MIALVLVVGIICIIVLVNNFVSIIHKVRDGNDTMINTFISCLTLIYLWVSIIILCTG